MIPEPTKEDLELNPETEFELFSDAETFTERAVAAEHERDALALVSRISDSEMVALLKRVNREFDHRATSAERDNAALRAECERLLEAIRYWSYCTWNGIRKECPELQNEFRDLCRSLGIEPYANAKEPS